MNQESSELTTISSPDALVKDQDSKAFYVLKDESIALCKHRSELPYHKNRQTYLSSGRYSPKYRTVIFWPESINVHRAFNLLVEQNLIESDYRYLVAGAITQVKGESKEKAHPGIGRHDRVRQAEISDLMKRGMRLQARDQGQEGQSEEV